MPRVKMDHFLNRARTILRDTPRCNGNTVFVTCSYRDYTVMMGKIEIVYAISFFTGLNNEKCHSVDGKSIDIAIDKLKEKLSEVITAQECDATILP